MTCHRSIWTSLGVAAALWAASFAAAPPLQASSLLALDLEALSATADRILVGTVEKVEPHYLAPESRYIVTDVTVRSERDVLGVAEGSRFVVRHLGGEVGKMGQLVHGEASYRAGEQVLLFAQRRGAAYFAVGMAQGVLHVVRDEAGVARVATHLAGADLVGRGAVAATDKRALDDVVEQVRSLVARREAAHP